jgi:hypothetical protein
VPCRRPAHAPIASGETARWRLLSTVVMGPEIGEMPRTSGSVCREDNVSGHKFKIGQTVRYAAPFSLSAAADYKITLLLPTQDNELQYRIKSANEPHERVAKESQLRRASS